VAIISVLAGPIDPGQRVTVDVPWSDAEAGRLGAEINPRFGRLESRTDNNTLERDTRPPLDLRVADLAFQTAHLEAGQQRRVAVTFRIINAGRRAITQAFRTRIAPGVVDLDGERPFFVTSAGVPAGGVIHVSHMIESAAADFTLSVTVDADEAIEESNEENNQATKRFSNPAPDIDRWVCHPSNLTEHNVRRRSNRRGVEDDRWRRKLGTGGGFGNRAGRGARPSARQPVAGVPRHSRRWRVPLG
jgi:CARDB